MADNSRMAGAAAEDTGIGGTGMLKFRIRGVEYRILKNVRALTDVFRPRAIGRPGTIDEKGVEDAIGILAGEFTDPSEEGLLDIMRRRH